MIHIVLVLLYAHSLQSVAFFVHCRSYGYLTINPTRKCLFHAKLVMFCQLVMHVHVEILVAQLNHAAHLPPYMDKSSGHFNILNIARHVTSLVSDTVVDACLQPVSCTYQISLPD